MRPPTSPAPRRGAKPIGASPPRKDEDAWSCAARRLQQHCNRHTAHHHAGTDRKLSIASLGAKSAHPPPHAAARRWERAGGPRVSIPVKHGHRAALKTHRAPASPARYYFDAVRSRPKGGKGALRIPKACTSTALRMMLGMISQISIIFGTGSGGCRPPATPHG